MARSGTGSTGRADDEEKGPKPPRPAKLRLGALQPIDLGVLDEQDDLDEVELRDLRADEMVWTGRRRLASSRVSGLAVRDWRARGASLVGSVLDQLDVVGLSAPESGWWNVEVTGSRIGSAELYDSSWRNVAFRNCKIGYLNLRGAQLSDVSFTDCVISELDLGRATAARVSVTGTLARLDVNGARLSDVDLRGARLDEIASLEGLRGATITIDQLLDLAPGLAARLGILVE